VEDERLRQFVLIFRIPVVGGANLTRSRETLTGNHLAFAADGKAAFGTLSSHEGDATLPYFMTSAAISTETPHNGRFPFRAGGANPWPDVTWRRESQRTIRAYG
jgi:hypothetical protein